MSYFYFKGINVIKGKIWIFGDNVDTDIIIAARYLNTSDPDVLAKYIMEDSVPNFYDKISKGDIILAGENFGCGSSREHAPIALKAAGISAIIAKSFARIFYRNSFNIGLPILECDSLDKSKSNDVFTIDMDDGAITNETQNTKHSITPIPEFMQELLNVGGLMEYAKTIKG